MVACLDRVAGTDQVSEALGLVHSSPEGLKQEHDPALAALCSQSVPSNLIFKSYFLTKPGSFGFAKYHHEVIKVHLFSHQRVFHYSK